MRKIASIAVLSLIAGGTTGCAIVASPVGNGALFTNVSGPVASGPGSNATKSGRAWAENYLGFVAVGDASTEAAKRSGGLTEVATVDHESFGVLGVYSRFCTIASGS